MGVLLSDSVLHACDIVFDVRNAVPAIFGAELDDGRADDHTVSVSSGVSVTALTSLVIAPISVVILLLVPVTPREETQ